MQLMSEVVEPLCPPAFRANQRTTATQPRPSQDLVALRHVYVKVHPDITLVVPRNESCNAVPES